MEDGSLYVCAQVNSCRSVSRVAPNFGVWLSVKTLYIRNPFVFCLSLYAAGIVISGYCIWVVEREFNTLGLEDFWTCQWLAMMILLSSWPDDPFGYTSPESDVGRHLCFFVGMVGLLLMTLILGVAANTLLPSQFETTVRGLCTQQP